MNSVLHFVFAWLTGSGITGVVILSVADVVALFIDSDDYAQPNNQYCYSEQHNAVIFYS